jgi:SEC-C motif
MTERNEICHCGSGKKYKRCCWFKDEQQKYRQFLSDRITSANKKISATGLYQMAKLAGDWVNSTFGNR